MEAAFRLLRDAYDIDFSHYKPATIGRRTDRRLALTGAATLVFLAATSLKAAPAA